MNILVIGDRGFVGRHLRRRLEQDDHEVVGCDWPEGARTLTTASGVAYDAIVNLAAVGGVGRARRLPAHVLTNNVETAACARAFAEWIDFCTDDDTEPLVVVQVSSFSVYGDAPVPTTEDAPLRPKEAYGASKLAQELCWAGYEGKLAIVRPSSIYGSGMDLYNPDATVVAKIAKAARERETFKVFEDGEQVRDFVHITDVIDLIATLIADPPEPARPLVVNACSGEPVSIKTACELLGAAHEITGVARPNDMRRCVGDPTRMRGILGRAPMSFFDHHDTILRRDRDLG